MQLTWSECLSPQNSYVEIQILKVMRLGGVTFGKTLGLESRALMNGISVLIKWLPWSSLTPSAMGGYRESGQLVVCNLEEGPHQNPTTLAP